MLMPERTSVFTQFTQDYERIRRAEGRGSDNPGYYRSLPYRDTSGRMKSDWRIRAASFDAFLKHVVLPMEQSLQKPLRVLDLGAGNGWLSNHLARRGHIVAAVDLMTNDFDGLGCYRFYDTVFTPVQAEFDHLPFPDLVADLAIFNASLHYSVSYVDALNESLRVLDPAGKIILIDSPIYKDSTSGAQMVRERNNQFRKKFGFPSDALPSENYITYERINELAAGLNLRCKIIKPYYGIHWLLRPLKALLLGLREPAKFHIIVYHRGGALASTR